MAPPRKKVLDFTNVKDASAFNPKHLPDGTYKAKITAVDEKPSKAGNDMWTFTVNLIDYPSAVYPHMCTLTPDSLWKVRNLFVACGVEIPKKKVNVDPTRLIGKTLMVDLEEDEYEGRMKSKTVNVMSEKEYRELLGDDAESLPDEDDEDDEDDEPTPPKKKAKKKVVVVEEEDDDEDEDEEDEEPEPPKKKAKKKKPPVDDDDDDIDIDEV